MATQLETRIPPLADSAEPALFGALIEAEPFWSSFGRLRRRPPVYAACSTVMAGTAWVMDDVRALWIAVVLGLLAAIAVARQPGPETVLTYTSDVVALTAGVVVIGLDPLGASALWAAITVVAFFGLPRRQARLVMTATFAGIAVALFADRDWALLDLTTGARLVVSITLTAIGFGYLATVIPSLADATMQVLREVGATAEDQRREADFRAKLASMVAHELRNPLAGIKGFIDVLATDGDRLPAEERAEYFAIVQSQTSSLEGIVEDLLVAVQAERGDFSVDLQTFDPTLLVRRVVTELGPDQRESIVVRAEDRLLAIGDPPRVAQVIRNLLTNARKYGGPNISVRCAAVADAVQIVVHDDGSGIPEESRDRVFEWFEGTGRGSRGYGLGLPISRQLAEAMGGSLVYDDGPGATFVLTLPAG